MNNNVKGEYVNSAFVSRITTYAIKNIGHTVPKLFLEDCYSLFKLEIDKVLNRLNSVKVNVNFQGEFEKTSTSEIRRQVKYLNSRNKVLFKTSNIINWYENNVINYLLTLLDDFEHSESGWKLVSIHQLTININKYEPFRGSSFIPLPKAIDRKKAVINVRNKDNKCFAYAILSKLYPPLHHATRASAYTKHLDKLNFDGLQFPITLDQIKKFEKLNYNISINVYILEENFNGKDNSIHYITAPIYLTKSVKDNHVHLLMLSEYDKDYMITKSHFCWIKNLSRLMSKQLSNHQHYIRFCDRCLHYFSNIEKLNEHTLNCKKQNDSTAIILPSEDQKWISFKNFNHQERVPFVIYGDTECMLKPVISSSSENNNSNVPYQKHIPYSMGIYLHCCYDNTKSYYTSCRGAECLSWFTDQLFQIANNIQLILKTEIPMIPLSSEEKENFKNATNCHICEKEFLIDGERKVHDHCHLTGKYRGPAHNSCNLNYKNLKFVPIVFHNLSGIFKKL